MPDAEVDGEEVEEHEKVDEGDEQTQETSPDTVTTTEQACSIIEELILTEPEEDKIEKGQNLVEEEQEAEQDDPKMTQGIAFGVSKL